MVRVVEVLCLWASLLVPCGVALHVASFLKVIAALGSDVMSRARPSI